MRCALCIIAAGGCAQLLGLDEPIRPDAAIPDAPSTLTLGGHTFDATGPILPDVVLTWQIDPIGSIFATTTSDTTGSYQLVIPYNGTPLAGYVKGSHANYVDSYYYPEAPPSGDELLDLPLATQATLNNLCMLVQVTCDSTRALVAIAVIDSKGNRVGGAQVSTAPSGTVKYDAADGLPSSSATATSTDGQAYVLNAPAGTLSVDAMLAGKTFVQHSMVARAAVFNLTQIVETP